MTRTFLLALPGDQVWSSRKGDGIVDSIDDMWLRVKFAVSVHSYLLDGRYCHTDIFPELFWKYFTPPDYAFTPPLFVLQRKTH